jgi:hypothetical protein
MPTPEMNEKIKTASFDGIPTTEEEVPTVKKLKNKNLHVLYRSPIFG